MKNFFSIQAYDFKLIFRISVYAACMSFGFIIFNPWIPTYVHELFSAIIIVGIPYYFFIKKIKNTLKNIYFTNNEIIINNISLHTQDIKSYRIANSLRLYFMLRINDKDGNVYTYYLPVTEKQNIESFFESHHINKSHVFSDYIAKYYLILYILTYFLMLGLVYYFGLQIYYLIKASL